MHIEPPRLTVDCVVFAGDAVVLIKRKYEPFKGAYALPGGFVEAGETVEQACARELKEETGLTATNQRLVGVYSDPGRDPRCHTVTVAFIADAEISDLKAGDDASSAELLSDWRELPVAFDHEQIVRDAWRLYRNP